MLIYIGKEKGGDERVQQYWDVYHCQNETYLSEKRVYSKYCKNRFCIICYVIGKADIINRYYPVLKQLKEPDFLTLTIKAIPVKNTNK